MNSFEYDLSIRGIDNRYIKQLRLLAEGYASTNPISLPESYRILLEAWDVLWWMEQDDRYKTLAALYE
ncbi:hypothetical protein [Shouchella miscanthi]|uniref:hypothetical protein n=1 Tax=Shouchella miscanthi TaxID=2598861 RepID=UPI0011A259F5|nr:hypothetical protein [Shouchella miscanthi]